MHAADHDAHDAHDDDIDQLFGLRDRESDEGQAAAVGGAQEPEPALALPAAAPLDRATRPAASMDDEDEEDEVDRMFALDEEGGGVEAEQQERRGVVPATAHANPHPHPLPAVPAPAPAAQSSRAAGAAAAGAAAAATAAVPPTPSSPRVARAPAYRGLLSNRDILFSAPIMHAQHPALAADSRADCSGATASVFYNAPCSFQKNPLFAQSDDMAFPHLAGRDDGGSSTATATAAELAEHLRVRDERMAAARAGSTVAPLDPGASAGAASSRWPISMRGKSIASVSASPAVKASLARRTEAEAEAEGEGASTLPNDSHVHGPGISDHTRRKAHWGGFWELRTLKLREIQANAAVYGALHVFEDEGQRSARAQREQRSADRKRRRIEREEERDAAAALPADVPFALAQATPASQASTPAAGSSLSHDATTSPSLKDERRLDTGRPLSASSSSSRPPLPRPSVAAASSSTLFAGVVAYINGDTETKHAHLPSAGGVALGDDDNDAGAASAVACATSGSGSSSELSSLHLSNLVKLHGGLVIPWASRRHLTHYVVDHLSFSKARQEMRAKVGGAKSATNAAARHIHFVKPAWIRACLQAGRRLREEDFALLHDTTHVSIRERWS